jgi:hypothetical protein
MGILFFLSGYLSLPSYSRKGAGKYAHDRLARFDIPLLFYAFAISPVTVWLAQLNRPAHLSLLAVYTRQQPFGNGVLWFVEALLLMDLLFVVWARHLTRADLQTRPGGAFPRPRALVAFIAGLGLASFLVRQAMPVGVTFQGFLLCYFPSYIAMFTLGPVARRQRWLDAIPDAAFRFARWAVVSGIVALPVLLILGTAGTANGAVDFAGGPHWQALARRMGAADAGRDVDRAAALRAASAEPAVPPLAGLGRASYLAYIIQPLFIVSLDLAFRGGSRGRRLPNSPLSARSPSC